LDMVGREVMAGLWARFLVEVGVVSSLKLAAVIEEDEKRGKLLDLNRRATPHLYDLMIPRQIRNPSRLEPSQPLTETKMTRLCLDASMWLAGNLLSAFSGEACTNQRATSPARLHAVDAFSPRVHVSNPLSLSCRFSQLSAFPDATAVTRTCLFSSSSHDGNTPGTFSPQAQDDTKQNCKHILRLAQGNIGHRIVKEG
jgi:hypothetical protein